MNVFLGMACPEIGPVSGGESCSSSVRTGEWPTHRAFSFMQTYSVTNILLSGAEDVSILGWFAHQ